MKVEFKTVPKSNVKAPGQLTRKQVGEYSRGVESRVQKFGKSVKFSRGKITFTPMFR